MELTDEELQAKIDEATTGLVDKNKELLGKMDGLKKSLTKFDELDLDLLQAQSNELKELKDKNLTDDERRDAEEKSRRDNSTATKQALLDSQAEVVKMRKENAIGNALRDAGQVNDGMNEAVTLLIKQKITMSDEGQAMVGEKTVAEYVKEFALNDGKGFFVPRNSGGGGNGSSAGGSDWAKYFDKASPDFNRTKQAELRKKNPELATSLAG